MAIPGFEVGGKTGTARIAEGQNRSHAWIIGFAGPPGETPHVAVAVVVLARRASASRPAVGWPRRWPGPCSRPPCRR
jgi:cell division protein FtsI/penicillin-binding protein 2